MNPLRATHTAEVSYTHCFVHRLYMHIHTFVVCTYMATEVVCGCQCVCACISFQTQCTLTLVCVVWPSVGRRDSDPPTAASTYHSEQQSGWPHCTIGKEAFSMKYVWRVV